jgi:outer membrane protein TolC
LLAQKKSLERLATLGRNVLKFQMYYPMEEEVLLTQSLDDIVDQVLMVDEKANDEIDYNKLPEYQTILLGEQLNDINLKATRNSRYPSIYGFANYQQQLQRNNLFDSDAPGFTPISIVGLTLNVPIYNGGEVAIKEQKIKLDMEKTSIQKNDFERAVDLQIRNAYQQYLNAKENMYSAKRQEALAEDIYDITMIKYKEGVGSSLETRQAERELYTAQQQYMQALFELVSSKVALDVSTGDINENPY